jgi:pimeloyl-ACP methyl ester carboxylesterase
MAAYTNARIMQPALYIAGDRDLVLIRWKAAADRLAQTVPNLKKAVILPGCGHWTQQERPETVNTELITFLDGLEGR